MHELAAGICGVALATAARVEAGEDGRRHELLGEAPPSISPWMDVGSSVMSAVDILKSYGLVY